MDNKRMAQRLANFCFAFKDEEDDSFAAHVFIEDTVLPSDCDSYTRQDLEQYIYNYLEFR